MSRPYVCPEHPSAKIRHEWLRDRTEVNWGPNRPRALIGEADRDHRYYCNDCGRELSPDCEASARRAITGEAG